MPKTTKDENYSQTHVLERAFERYNLVLSEADYQTLNTLIKTKNAQLLAEADAGEEVWGVNWPAGGKTLACVYSVEKQRVMTLLPEGTVVTGRKKQRSAGKGTSKK